MVRDFIASSWAWVGVCSGGLTTRCAPQAGHTQQLGSAGFGAGEIVTLAAAAFAAGALVFTKGYIETVDPVSLTALQAGCSAFLALCGSLVFEGGIHLERTTPTAWLIILYLAIACTFLGYLMQNLALTRISERSVALLQTLCPVMTAVFSFMLLGEKLSAAGMAGAAIILVCVAASVLMTGTDREEPEGGAFRSRR